MVVIIKEEDLLKANEIVSAIGCKPIIWTRATIKDQSFLITESGPINALVQIRYELMPDEFKIKYPL